MLLLEESRFIVAQETVHGIIAEAPAGENGFGYDPLFLVPGPGRTMAELPDEEKDEDFAPREGGPPHPGASCARTPERRNAGMDLISTYANGVSELTGSPAHSKRLP